MEFTRPPPNLPLPNPDKKLPCCVPGCLGTVPEKGLCLPKTHHLRKLALLGETATYIRPLRVLIHYVDFISKRHILEYYDLCVHHGTELVARSKLLFNVYNERCPLYCPEMHNPVARLWYERAQLVKMAHGPVFKVDLGIMGGSPDDYIENSPVTRRAIETLMLWIHHCYTDETVFSKNYYLGDMDPKARAFVTNTNIMENSFGFERSPQPGEDQEEDRARKIRAAWREKYLPSRQQKPKRKRYLTSEIKHSMTWEEYLALVREEEERLGICD